MATCLIIEDYPPVRAAMADRLKAWGHQVDEAQAAEGARRQTAKVAYDVIFLDWDMDRSAAIDLLREFTTDQPDNGPSVVLCMAENDHRVAALARAAGARHILLKPIDPPALEEAMVACGFIAETLPVIDLRDIEENLV